MNTIDNLPVYNLTVDTEDTGVFAVSLVENPAIESNFIALAEESIIKMSKSDSDKMIITGPALIPDILIYRKSPEPHYIKMSKGTIEEAQLKFCKLSDNGAVNFEHNPDNVSDVTITEQWIVVDKEKDKSTALGLDVPEGTWMMSMKIDDPEKWEEIKNQELFNGISIEGLFTKNLDNNLLQKMAENAKTYTQEEVDALIAKALEEKVAAQEEPKNPEEPKTYTKEEVEKMIAEAIEAYKAKVAEEEAAKLEEEAAAQKKKDEEEEAKLSSVMDNEAANKNIVDAFEYFKKLKNQ